MLNARHRCPKGPPAEAVANACFARLYRAGPRDLVNERGIQLNFAAFRAARRCEVGDEVVESSRTSAHRLPFLERRMHLWIEMHIREDLLTPHPRHTTPM